MHRVLHLGLLAAAVAGFARPTFAGPSTDKINTKIDRLTLTGLDGKPFSPQPAEGKKITVVVFLSFDCPVSRSYCAPLSELAEKYAGQGVAFVGVVAGEEPLATLKKQAADFKLDFPLYADPTLAAVDALKATTVPEAFVLDHNFVLRYRGRIDDGYSARLKRNNAASSHDLRDALDALLTGRDVKTPVTQPVGCAVGRKQVAAKPGADTSVTFYKDVLSVLQVHCQSCHRPGQVGPFSLTSYKQAVNWAEDIKEYTRSRKMPPWKPRGGPGYANTRQMADKEIATLAAWVDGGCPEGNPHDAPPPAKFSDEWQLGPPDLVLTVPEAFHVGPSGKDVFRCFVLPTGLAEDKYIVGYEVKPGNPRVVHHTLNFWDTTGKARQLAARQKEKAADEPDAQDHGPGYSVAMGLGFIPIPNPKRPGVPPIGGFGGWAPGAMARRLPDGAGYRLPAGADIVIQTHYHRTGRPETDQLKIGLYFAKEPVKKAWQTLTIRGMGPLTRIPAGEAEYHSQGSIRIKQDATVYSVMPHMHLLGKTVKVTMTPPDGQPTTLVEIPEWDYNWQETYWLKTPIHAKAGTRFTIEAVYDNSSANPNNPSNPPKDVKVGEQTTNEMLFGFIGVTPVGEGRVRVERLGPQPLRAVLDFFKKRREK
jgi:mono/diheme cytochrome c family protein